MATIQSCQYSGLNFKKVLLKKKKKFYFSNKFYFVNDWFHILLCFSKSIAHFWVQLFEQHSVIHFMIFSSAGFRTLRYYSRPLSLDNTEQQCSQGGDKIQGKPHGTSKKLKGGKKSLGQKLESGWWQLTLIFLIKITARGSICNQNEHIVNFLDRKSIV